MIPVRTGISIRTHGSHQCDVDRATGTPRVLIFRMFFVYLDEYPIRQSFILTGIYDKVNSTLENPRYRIPVRQKISRSAHVHAIPVANTRGYTRGSRILAKRWHRYLCSLILCISIPRWYS